MNDIDRSVESMDFAMRRRFTWKEITPDDTAEMLDSLAYSDEAKKRMKSLNDAIASTDGLGRAFMIGPSYFLKLKDYHENFNMLWSLHIEPLLREYLRGFRNADKSIKLFRQAFDNSQEANE
jgi:5-methylcytosine-specific restriction endonuclease McrBC GTP-binding regulatory subunit McrB